MALVEIGKVVRAVGLSGFVGVGGSEGALKNLSEVTLRRSGEPDRRVTVREAREQGRLWAVLLEGVATREAAEALVGAQVLTERAELGDAEPGKHFWIDLEGLDVFTVSGLLVGKVTEFYATGGVDVLVVTGERGEVLVPLAPYVEVDLAKRRIVVDPPAGLLAGFSEGS